MKTYRTGPETRRLTHRAFTLEDAEVFYLLNSDPDVMRLTGEPPLLSLESARETIAGYPDFESVGYGRWACVLKETDTVIGFCGLKYLSDLDAVDVGYRFLTPYWGRGFATEACRASLEFGFSTLGLEQIIGLVFAENVASVRVLEKMGMRLDSEFVFDGMPARRYALDRRDGVPGA